MKNVIIIMVVVVLSITNSYAQKLNIDKVPAAVMNAFNSKFPSATKVKWSMENSKEYEAEFKINKVNQSANFSEAGTWIETEIEISKSQLPQVVIEAINKKYPNCKINEIEQGSSPENSLFYAVAVTLNDKVYDIDLKLTGEIIEVAEVKENEKD